jgi:hypothetical protein
MIPSENKYEGLSTSRADRNGDQPQRRNPLVTALAALLATAVLLLGGAVAGLAGGWTPGLRVTQEHPLGVGGVRDCALHFIQVSAPYPISFVSAVKDGHTPYRVVADRNVIRAYFRFHDHDHVHHNTITFRTPFGERTISIAGPHICI